VVVQALLQPGKRKGVCRVGDHHRPYLFWHDAVDGRNSMCYTATGPGRCMWSTPFSVEHEPGVHIQALQRVCSGVCDSLTPV
jgi:hypothetical protein